MLITLIAMQGVWLAWRECQQRLSTGRGGVERGADARPFLTTLLERYRREMTMSDQRRARTRKAVERLSAASERKLRAGMRRR